MQLLRLIFVCCLIVSLFGIAFCDAVRKDWKTFVLGVLFATANIVIFGWKNK